MLLLTFILFLAFPILSIPWVIFAMIIDRRFVKLYLILFCISMATIGFYYSPIPTADGSRVLDRLHIYSAWNIKDMINYHGFDKEPISQLLFYFASQTTTPKILFAISGFLTYFLTLYPIIDYCKNNKVKYTTFLLAISLILSYHTIVSNFGAVRYPLGLSVVMYSWYIIYMKDRKVLGFSLSVVAMLIHNSFLPHLVILLISHFTFRKKKSNFQNITFWIILLIWGSFSNQLIGFVDIFEQYSIINSVGDKLEIYVERGYTNYWYIILSISGGVVTLFTLFTVLKKRPINDVTKKHFDESKRYFYLLTNYFIFVLGSAIYANIFVRFLILSVMLSTIPLIIQNSKKNYHSFIFNIIAFFAILTGSIYQLSMDLSVENGWNNILFKNIFTLWLNKLI